MTQGKYTEAIVGRLYRVVDQGLDITSELAYPPGEYFLLDRKKGHRLFFPFSALVLKVIANVKTSSTMVTYLHIENASIYDSAFNLGLYGSGRLPEEWTLIEE